MDEPASDFSPEAATELAERLAGIDQLPTPARIRAFLQAQLGPGVEPPPPPPGPPPPWMQRRPAGIDAFAGAVRRYRLSPEQLSAVSCPVYYSYGSLSWSYWERMRDRLAGRLPRFAWELYEGAHHLDTSHHREPARVAAALRRLWRDVGRGGE